MPAQQGFAPRYVTKAGRFGHRTGGRTRGKGHANVVLLRVSQGSAKPSERKEPPGRLPTGGSNVGQVTCDLRLKRSARHSPDSTTSTSAVAASKTST